MPAAMPCRTKRKVYRETCRTSDARKTKKRMHRWSLRIYEKAHGRNSTQRSWRPYCRERNWFIEPLQFGEHQGWKELDANLIKIASLQKRWILWLITVLFTNSFRCFKHSKYQMRKQQWTKDGKNSRKCKHGKRPESGAKKRWSMKHGIKVEKFILRHWCISVISRIRSWNHNFKKYKGRVVPRGDMVKDDAGSYAVFTRQRWSVAQMTAAKVMDVMARLPGCAGQAADAVSAETQVKMEDAQKLLKIPKSECPDIWIRRPRHKWPTLWSCMEDPVVPLERNLYGNPLAGVLWKRQFEKVLLEHGWEKSSKLGMLVCETRKMTTLICVCGRFKPGWEETKHWPNVESTFERSRFGRANIIPWPRLFGLHWTRMRNKQRYCGKLQKYVWLQNLCRSNRKTVVFRETWLKYLYIIFWFGRRKEMCGGLLRAGEQNKPATVRSCNTMPGWPSIQRRRIGIRWRSVKSMLQNCPEMYVFGTHWKTWYSMVSE